MGDGSARLNLAGLQALRATAALLVVADHALGTYVRKVRSGPDDEFAWLLGDTGVWVFFVISGLTMVLAHGMEFGMPGAALSFAKRRVGRIVPLYWLVTLGSFVELKLRHAPITVAGLGLSLLFIPHQPGNEVFGRPLYGPGWTLEYEMFFYAVFGVCLMFPRRVGPALLVGCLGGLAGGSVAGLLAPRTVIGFVAQPITLLFLAGGSLGLVRRRLGHVSSWRWGFTGAVSISAVALGGSLLWAGVTDASAWPVRTSCVAAAIVSVGAAALAVEAPRLSLLARVARAVGNATFSIYLTHEFVLGPCGRVAALVWPGMPRVFFVLVTSVLAVLFGLAVFRFVERPMVKGAGRLLDRGALAWNWRRSPLAAPAG